MSLATTDQIFESWRVLREKIAEDSNNANMIYKSSVCLSRSLTSTNFFTHKECCTGCSTLKTLMSSFFLDSEREIRVASGTKKGTVIKIFSRENVDTSIDNGITTNPFMNYVVVSCIMKKILRLKSYPVNIPYEWSYVCKDRFNIALDVTNILSIKDISRLKHLTTSSPLASKTVYSPINKDITESIFKQLVLLCHFYSMYKFSHGEPSITYISLSPVQTRLRYNGHAITSSLKLSISPSVYSSVVYNQIRFALKRYANRYPRTYETRDVGIEGQRYSGHYDQHRVIYVKIGNKSEQFLKNLVNGICDITSFDFVMFLTCIMVNTQFMATFKTCPYIDIWKNIWRKQDYEGLSRKLSELRTNSFKTIFSIVKQYYFRVDALEYAMSKI